MLPHQHLFSLLNRNVNSHIVKLTLCMHINSFIDTALSTHRNVKMDALLCLTNIRTPTQQPTLLVNSLHFCHWHTIARTEVACHGPLCLSLCHAVTRNLFCGRDSNVMAGFLTRLEVLGFQAPAGHLLALASIGRATDAQLMDKNSLRYWAYFLNP